MQDLERVEFDDGEVIEAQEAEMGEDIEESSFVDPIEGLNENEVIIDE